jgi:hypothetical protein
LSLVIHTRYLLVLLAVVLLIFAMQLLSLELAVFLIMAAEHMLATAAAMVD